MVIREDYCGLYSVLLNIFNQKNHNFYHIRNILVDTVITLLFEVNPELKGTVASNITGF